MVASSNELALTKREFFEARAKADYLKRHGAVQCPPAAADGSAPLTRFRSRPRGNSVMRVSGMKMSAPTLRERKVFDTFTSPIRKEDEPDAS